MTITRKEVVEVFNRLGLEMSEQELMTQNAIEMVTHLAEMSGRTPSEELEVFARVVSNVVKAREEAEQTIDGYIDESLICGHKRKFDA